MATEAKVRSIDALETFRASLVVFLARARRALDQVGDEVSRTRQWVETDRRLFWAEHLRKRTRAMERAEQELFSAKLSSLKDSVTMQELALRKARKLVEDAGEKVRNVKVWSRDFDRCADPLVKRLETMRHYLDNVMPKAMAHLAAIQRTLESYSETAPIESAPPPPPEPQA